ncbi:hypothetical protein GOD64_28285 [Sinorhizobium medicae]|nr:hypothetical protein [Sinorhizobium medicae]
MISETIHVAYPDVLGIGDHDRVHDLTGSLAAAAEKATAIDILGGYYSLDRTFQLLKKVPRAKRSSCKIRLAIGLDASAKIKQHWTDMRSLEQKLRESGFRDVTLSIVTGAPSFSHQALPFSSYDPSCLVRRLGKPGQRSARVDD